MKLQKLEHCMCGMEQWILDDQDRKTKTNTKVYPSNPHELASC